MKTEINEIEYERKILKQKLVFQKINNIDKPFVKNRAKKKGL